MGDRLFAFAGQSNISGYPGIGELPAHLQDSDAGIKIWTGSAFETLDNCVNNNDLFGGESTFGPEAELAYQFRQEFPSETIYLIKYALGGTSLYDISPTANWNSALSNSYFHNMTTRITSALAALSSPTVEALIWGQGEYDSRDQTHADAYETNLLAFAAKARTDWMNAVTRFVLGQMYSADVGAGNYPYIDTVRAAQASVAAADTVGTHLVDTSTMTRYASTNTVHITGAGQVQFGQACWNAYKAGRRFRMKWDT